MGQNTLIQWTGSTWTPIRARNRETGAVGWHCEKPSAGCKNCYAEKINLRLGTRLAFTVPNREKVDIFLDEKMALNPTRWRKPRSIFPCSMTDLFGEFVPEEMIYSMLAVMSQSPDHTFQVLTKRAGRAYEILLDADLEDKVNDAGAGLGWCHANATERFPLPNVQIGFSAEDQANFDRRWLSMRKIARLGWFVWASIEPQIGPIKGTSDPLLRWAVIGGESGHEARVFDIRWAQDILSERRRALLPTFMKQLGAHPQEIAYPTYTTDAEAAGWIRAGWTRIIQGDTCHWRRYIRLKDRKGGDMSEWPADLRIREFPKATGAQHGGGA